MSGQSERPRGRPRGRRLKGVSVYLTREELEQVDGLSRELGVPRGVILRMLVTACLKTECYGSEPRPKWIAGLSAHLSRETIGRVDELAERWGVSRSACVRTLVAECLRTRCYEAVVRKRTE